MVEVVVTDEAGRGGGEVADEVRAAVAELAGRVERRTGLGLGPECHVRLLNPDAYALAHEAHERRVAAALLAGDLLHAIPDPVHRRRVKAALRLADSAHSGAYSAANRTFGCLPSSRAQPGADGGCTILLAPALLRRSAGAASRDAVRSVLAHQLVHQAQFRLWGPSLVLDLRVAHLTHLASRAAAGERPDLSAVLEGHARFTARELLAADFVEERKAGRLVRRLWGPSRGPALYDRGEDCVRKAVESGVTDLPARLRADPELAPAARELADPDCWVARLTGADEPVRPEPAGS